MHPECNLYRKSIYYIIYFLINFINFQYSLQFMFKINDSDIIKYLQ